MLTQKVIGYQSQSTVLLIAEGNCFAGLACIGKQFHAVGITPKGIAVETDGKLQLLQKGLFSRLWLRVTNDCHQNPLGLLEGNPHRPLLLRHRRQSLFR